MNAKIESVTIAGRRLSWRLAGSGPPLLLVNGYAATGADWDPGFLTGLAEKHEVICPDNRGVGESDPGSDSLTIDTTVEDLRAVLDAQGIESCPVVGWSMGGFAAQRLAEAHPALVSALGLLATDPGGPAAVTADPLDWDRLIDHSGSPREQATRLISLLFPPPVAAEIDRQFGNVVAEARAALSPSVLRAQEQAMEAWHRDDRLPPTALPPTLILHGRGDRVIPAANAELVADRWGGGEIEIFNGCGHALMAQRPDTAARLCEFFAGR